MDDQTLRAAVVGIRPTHEGAPAAQAVLDAAAVLQVRRAEVSVRISAGRPVQAEVVAVGLRAMNEWLFEQDGWHEVASTKPSARVDQIRGSLPLNRHRIASGVQMTSLWDYQGTEPAGRAVLAAEPPGTYFFGVAPVQMKICDRRMLLVQGPTIRGDQSLMVVRDHACLDAAWHFWHTAMEHAVPAHEAGTASPAALTPRQRQIMSLLSTDHGDEAIARTLGISVRTVRSDVAAVLDTLGVKSRFAAGVRLTIWDADGVEGADEAPAL